MFGSWKCTTTEAGILLSKCPRHFDPTAAKTAETQACTQCRARKIRCTGEKRGRRRCQELEKSCYYTTTPSTTTLVKRSHPRTDKSEQTLSNNWPSEFAKGEARCHSSPESYQPVDGDAAAAFDKMVPPCQEDHQTADAYPIIPDIENNVLEDLPLERGFAFQALGQQGLDSTLHKSPIFAMAQDEPPLLSMTTGDSTASIWLDSVDTSQYLSPSWHLDADNAPEEVVMTHQTPKSPESDLIACSRQIPTATQCSCLHKLILLMDGLEGGFADNDIQLPVDNVLVTYRETIRRGTQMLECAACKIRVDNLTILSFLIRRLARVWRRIVLAICTETLTSASLGDGETPFLSMGTYQLEAPEEYAAVARSLFAFQLTRLHLLTQKLGQLSMQLHTEPMAGEWQHVKRPSDGPWISYDPVHDRHFGNKYIRTSNKRIAKLRNRKG